MLALLPFAPTSFMHFAFGMSDMDEGHYLRTVLLGKGAMVGMMAVFGQSLLSSLRNPGYLVLAIAIAGMLGPNLVNAVIAISAVSWTKYARLARSLVLKIKSELAVLQEARYQLKSGAAQWSDGLQCCRISGRKDSNRSDEIEADCFGKR